VPVLPDGSILMLWQYRYPHGKTHWEVPAGRIHGDEPPAEAAARELREESGHTCGRLEPLPGFYPMNGITAHYVHAFVAHDCVWEGPVQLDEAERIEVRALPRAEVERMLLAGEIADGFTALSLHYALART
jgi:8-oxo-dGTP pyrophosphatase MutT (NUDIX family)